MNKGHKYSYKIVIIVSSRSLLLCTMVQLHFGSCFKTMVAHSLCFLFFCCIIEIL